MGRTRRSFGGAVVASWCLAALAVVAVAAPAQAATLEGVTATPDTGLVSGQQVSVEVSATGPGDVAACQAIPDIPAFFGGPCRGPVRVLNGHTGSITVERYVPVPDGVADCADPAATCVVLAFEIGASGQPVGQPVSQRITFAAPPPPEAPGEIALSRSSGIDHGDTIEVTGTGFRPSTVVDVRQCIAEPAHQRQCGNLVTGVTTDATGGFSAELTVLHELSVLTSWFAERRDCRTAPGTCVVVAHEHNDFDQTLVSADLDLAVDQVVVKPGSGEPRGEGNPPAPAVPRQVRVPVALNAPAPTAITVDWTTVYQPTMPAGAAVPGVDYVAASGTVTISAGSSTANVLVDVLPDLVDEPDEYVVVAFSNPSGGATIGGFLGLGFGTIADDDRAPAIVPGAATAAEGADGTQLLHVPVTLDRASASTVTAAWTTLEVPGFSHSDGDQAEPGTDYTATAGTVTFAPGATSATVAIPVHGDLDPERDELVVVSFTNPANATLGGLWGLGFGGILDDD